jgi:hypothetical protein
MSNMSATPFWNATSTEATHATPGELHKVMYSWILPVSIGVPGNIMAILVASREHNRKLSPCIYMIAMAVADTVVLLEVAWSIVMARLFDKGIIKSLDFLVR